MIIHHQVSPFPAGFSQLTWPVSEAGLQLSSQFLQEDQKSSTSADFQKN